MSSSPGARMDTGTSDENGRMLASRYVKGRMDSGQSKLPLQKVALNAEQEAQNEIDMTTIPREAQEAFKDYFTQLQRGN